MTARKSSAPEFVPVSFAPELVANETGCCRNRVGDLGGGVIYVNRTGKAVDKRLTVCNDGAGDLLVTSFLPDSDQSKKLLATIGEDSCQTIDVSVAKDCAINISQSGTYRCG